jgi:hypothetical protein
MNKTKYHIKPRISDRQGEKKGKQNNFIHAAACWQAIRNQYKKRKKNHFKQRISDRQSVKDQANKTNSCRACRKRSIQETKEKSLQAADFRQAIGERKGKQNQLMPRLAGRQLEVSARNERKITSSRGFPTGNR